MVFLQVFTTIYDYARPIGPLFRDRFWLVYLIAGLGLVGGMAMAGRISGAEGEAMPRPYSAPKGALWAAGAIVALIGVALVLTRPHIAQPSSGAVRVMTYNIQQGFDKVGNAALPAQLAAIRRVDPDILGLEESDTARVANGNVDAVRYFADHLGMYSYYGPPTTAGTFGIALLSKYPIQRARTFYMVSTGEQTACIQAVITANGKTYNVFVTHLGNGGPILQLIDVLHETLGLPNVMLMGDFNFDPTTPQYVLATQTLADAWLLRWPAGRQLTGGAEGRIDQLFVSPDMLVTEAEYVPAPASDHPYLWAVVR
jgi:endonuclease/exonuclease/phosphatase family metal-dependent hydrolase